MMKKIHVTLSFYVPKHLVVDDVLAHSLVKGVNAAIEDVKGQIALEAYTQSDYTFKTAISGNTFIISLHGTKAEGIEVIAMHQESFKWGRITNMRELSHFRQQQGSDWDLSSFTLLEAHGIFEEVVSYVFDHLPAIEAGCTNIVHTWTDLYLMNSDPFQEITEKSGKEIA